MADFECREAAIFAQLSPVEFQTLHWSERAKIIAHYRLHERIQGWQHWNATQGS